MFRFDDVIMGRFEFTLTAANGRHALLLAYSEDLSNGEVVIGCGETVFIKYVKEP